MKLIDWRRQRTIAYPWHVNAPANCNWLPFSSSLRRRRARRELGQRPRRRVD